MLGLDVAFDVLTVYMHEAGRPPPHEMRNRMTSVRNDLHKILKRLGVKPELLDMKTWHPSALDLNPNIMSELVDGANDDRDQVYSCIRAMGALADIADEARRKAEYRMTNAWSVGAARIAFAQKLMDAHESIFRKPPTETRNGKWHNFATWAFKRAGLPLGPDGPRDLLRAIKRNKAKQEKAAGTAHRQTVPRDGGD